MNFHEYIIKRKKGAKEILFSILLYLLAAVLSVVLLLLFIALKLSSLAALAAFGCFYLAYRISTGMNKEFEYIFSGDSITVDVIKNASRRKRLFSFSLSETDIIAPIDDPDYKHLLTKTYDREIDATSKNGHSTEYFAVISAEKQVILKFEPPHSALEELFKYAPSKIKIKK